MYNYTFLAADTDSVTVCKPDQTPFSEEEQEKLLQEINNLFPELISWEQEGPYKKIIMLKAKNYILYDPSAKLEKDILKIKGSALKSSTKEEALKDFLNEIISTIINEEYMYEEIYEKYIKEALNVKNIKRWSSKKTVTSKVLNAERTNEKKVLDALEGTDYNEGDKRYFFFKKDSSLCLVEQFTGEYDELALVKKLYKTAEVFSGILPVKELFPNLTLKKNLELLEKYK